MISVKNIDFKYAGQKNLVFHDFSLQLNENNIYGLLGKNGTGKSTLLYLIAGLLRPSRGEVSIEGIPSKARRPEVLQELFIVPEEFDMPQMTLSQYVKIHKPFYPNFSQEILEKCLKDFDMPTAMKLQSLSMGQKKKVFMSFALASQTKLLLMDEPTNGLDIPSKTQFRRVVANNMTDDRTLIISTHQVHDVESLLDHILILNNSRLLLDAPVSDICDRFAFEYRMPGIAPDDDVLYSEPSVQGEAVITRRKEGMTESPLNLELLFNAITMGKIQYDSKGFLTQDL